MARKKSTALEAPSTIAEATELLGRYAEIMTHIEEMRASADVSIAAIEAERDAFIKPLEEQLKTLFTQARAWWAVAGEALTEGKRKSTELAGCLIGVRTTTPALKLPTGTTPHEIIDDLIDHLGREPFTVTKSSLNKPLIISVLRRGPPEEPNSPSGLLANAIFVTLSQRLGLSVTQREEFFIDRARTEPAPANPETLAPEGEDA